MAFAVRVYDLVLWIHITAVVTAFGALFAYPVFLAVNARGPIHGRAALHQMQIAFSKRVTGPAIGIVFLAGAYMASDADVWGEAWVIVPFVLLLIIAGLGVTVLRRGEERLLATAEEGDERGYGAALSGVARWTYLELLLVVVTIFVMAAKPF